MKRFLLLPPAFAAFLTSALAADLNVTTDAPGQKGAVYFALYDRASFLEKPIAVVMREPANPTAIFQDLAAGNYAVSVFQDVNDSGKLDRNLMGAPLEPYGFSNDATGTMGPPGFYAAAVQIGAENQSIVIKLR